MPHHAYLPVRVRHLSNEPAYDLFRRLGLAMGQRSPLTFAKEVGLNWHAVRSGKATREVAQLAGVDHERLAASTFKRAEDGVEFRGMTFERKEWIPGIRVCLSCILKDKQSLDNLSDVHRRFWWDLQALDRCPEHGTRLIDSCTKCTTPVIAHGRTTCPCGENLLSMSQASDGSNCAWGRYFVGRILGRQHSPVPLLDGLPPTLLSSAVASIAGLARNGEGELSGLANDGFVLASNDDTAIEMAMAGRPAFDAEREDLRSYLNPLQSWLQRTKDPGSSRLHGLLRKFAEDQLPLTSGTTLLGGRYENLRFFNRVQLQQELGTDVHVVTALFKCMANPKARRSPDAIPNELAERMRAEYASCITGTTARIRLGLPPDHAHRVLAVPGGVLPRTEWSSESRPYVKLLAVSALELAADIELPVVETFDRETMLTLQVWKIGLESKGEADWGVVVNAMLSGLLSGELRPVSRATRGVRLAGLAFRREEVKALVGRVDWRLDPRRVRRGTVLRIPPEAT